MMGTDENATLDAATSQREGLLKPLLATHSGRLVKTLGDGFLAEFQSVVDAVAFSVAFHDAVADAPERVQGAPLKYRIGINLGDIIIEDGDVYGDGVNIAARLEALAPIGGTCVNRSVRDQVRDKLNIEMTDRGEVSVKNIARPIRVFEIGGEGTAPKAAPEPAVHGRSRTPIIIAAIIAFAIAALAAFMLVPGQEPRSGVAVLPFEDLSADGSQRAFAQGVAEDILTDLSRVEGLTVADPSATKRLARMTDDPGEIAEELGVLHLLIGSVRRAGGDIRVTVSLSDPEREETIWAERYDRPVGDVFAVQAEIAASVASALGRKIADAPVAHRPVVEAYDAYVRGRAIRIPPTPANLTLALERFEDAIRLDPDYAGGYAGASYVHSLRAFSPRPVLSPEAHLAEALALARRAVELDPGSASAYGALAEALVRTRRFDEALTAINKAIARAPSDALYRATKGRLLAHLGKPAEGEAEARAALAMNPASLPALFFLGMNQRLQGNYSAAIKTLRTQVEGLQGQVAPAPMLELAAAEAQSGDLSAARGTISLIREAYPEVDLSFAVRTHPFARSEDAEAFSQALVAAGLASN